LSVVKGSYCWDGLIHQECVDTALPAELIEHNQMVPVIIAPEALITIHFSRNPRKKSVGVSQWLNDREAKTIQLKRNSFHAPKEEGLYIYSVHAGWPKGDVSYAFAVKVHK
ncbi:MAG TPA: hypothetical protein VEY51_12695, partial [Chondromyces sp.]|nr:hypothetical protein [Chondromyces sp.]